MIALKVITNALYGFMKPHLPKSCTHVKEHGGLKKAVQQTYNAMPEYAYFFRSDIKQYYESICFNALMAIIDRYVKHPILTQLILKSLKRIETFGGNFYDTTYKGLAKRCPLSPLLAAIALMPLDHAMEGINGIFYVRFVDDWLVFTKSKTMLRKVIKKTHRILKELHLTMHPHKTYMGSIQKGFNFLGYFYQPSTLLPSLESIRRFRERSIVRYAQPKMSRRRIPPSRDVSDYQVNERAPTDDDMTRVLWSISWQLTSQTDRARGLQTYLRRWSCWFKAGLTDNEAFMQSVAQILPSLAAIWVHTDINTVLLNTIN